nr:probable LRR receptor-like serine/threonine-protein kinase At3g47570 [Coffea arabica]
MPSELVNLSNLQTLVLENNRLTGSIPVGIFNISTLGILSLSNNSLQGNLPSSIGYGFPMLQFLHLDTTNLSGVIPGSISNLSQLIVLELDENKFSGFIPGSLGNLQLLERILVSSNLLRSDSSNEELGFITSLTNCRNLRALGFDKMPLLNGKLPASIRNFSTSIERIYGYKSNIQGRIPKSIGNLSSLLLLSLYGNQLTGPIPTSVGRSLPPEVANLEVATTLVLSVNQFSGDIPSAIGKLGNLNYLSLAQNQFQGSMPESMGKMVSLQTLDLSHNNLSGLIPSSLEWLQSLLYFDVSFNKLRGQIPSGGPFENFTSESFISNEALCGPTRFHVPPCPKISNHHKSKTTRIVLIFLGIIAILGALAVFLVYLRYHKKKDRASNDNALLSLGTYERISYYELLQATDRYNEGNLLGTGGFGSVYCGTLNDGRKVAVKVFHVQLERALKSFYTECEVLRNLRHRNLTKVISGCSNNDFKALVLELMPNGSLAKWLHSPSCFLDMKQRLNIMIDVACALHYLHNGYSTPVVHCDLKPSNVLLDQDMIAHVSNFGIAKLLNQEDGLVSTKCDVYSYGIMLMEVFTRTKPNDARFNGNSSLKDLVQSSMPNALYQIIDANLLQEDEEHFAEKLDCISFIMEIALNCSRESPRERSMQY